MKKNFLLIVSGISLSSFFFEFLRYANRPGRGLGRCDGRHYRRSSDWAGSLCGDWRGRPPFSTALIQVGSMIFAVCRPVDLLATLIRVVSFAGHRGRRAAVR